jgi:hypothetical protein
MTIADMSTINVEVNVDETEVSNVEVGWQSQVDAGRNHRGGYAKIRWQFQVRHAGRTFEPRKRSGSESLKSPLNCAMPDGFRNGLRPA